MLYPELSYKLNRMFFDTHNALGRFRREAQYCDYYETLLIKGKMEYIREYALPPSFDGERERRNIIDFMVANLVVIDFKTKNIITKEDYCQMQRYLVSSGKELGIIVNFRQRYLVPKRVLNTSLFHKQEGVHKEHMECEDNIDDEFGSEVPNCFDSEYSDKFGYSDDINNHT